MTDSTTDLTRELTNLANEVDEIGEALQNTNKLRGDRLIAIGSRIAALREQRVDWEAGKRDLAAKNANCFCAGCGHPYDQPSGTACCEVNCERVLTSWQFAALLKAEAQRGLAKAEKVDRWITYSQDPSYEIQPSTQAVRPKRKAGE
jgi:hypothetical protein